MMTSPAASDALTDVSTATAHVAYDGEIFRVPEDGASMDVRDLAPALLKLGHLCERANLILNGNETQVSVRIRADFQSGSFEIIFKLVQSLRERLRGLFTDQQISSRRLLELLGLTGAATDNRPTVLSLYKRLKGQVPTPKAVLEDGSVTLEDYDGIIPAEVWRLYSDATVRRKVDGVLAPLEKPGVDEFQVKTGDTVTEVVTKNEVQEVREAGIEAQIPPGELLARNEFIVPVEIVKVPFRTNLLWNLLMGGQRLNAEMIDQEFLERHQAGLTEFSAGDILRVELRQMTWRTEKGLKTKNEIVRVVEQLHQPGRDGQATLR